MSQPAPSTPTRPPHWLARPATWVKATVLYWLALFAATHFPGSGEAAEFTVVDKFMHFGAFTILAALVGWTCFLVTGGLTLRHLVVLGLTMAAYGAVDELTQPLVGRGCELLDWVGDVAGIILGLGFAKLYATKRGPPRTLSE